MTREKGTAPFRELKNQKVFSVITILAGLLLMFVSAPFIVIKIETLVIVSGVLGILLFFLYSLFLDLNFQTKLLSFHL